MRPTKEDRDALRLLLAREDLSDWDAELVESLRNWRGEWRPKQAVQFDRLCAEYFESVSDDANREMDLDVGEDWGHK